MTTLRICIFVALLSLAQAAYTLTRDSSFAGESRTLPQRAWAVSLAPAIFLSYAVLPDVYTRLHCYEDTPAHEALIVRSTFVVAHVIFWTTFACVISLLVRFYRGGTASPRRRRIHIGLVSIAAATAPLLALWLYFLLSGSANRRNMGFDIFAVAISALIGCAVLSILPLTAWRRILIIAVYCPVAFYALILCSRIIALKLFGDQL
jgi:hypothetical protein